MRLTRDEMVERRDECTGAYGREFCDAVIEVMDERAAALYDNARRADWMTEAACVLETLAGLAQRQSPLTAARAVQLAEEVRRWDR